MAIRRSITAASKHTSQSKSDRRTVLLSPLQSRPSPQACCAAHMLVTHTCLLCVALPRKPSCRSVCSSKPQLHPNTKTNYITHPSWLAMHDRNQPCGEVTACYLGDLMSCVERSSKLTLTVAAGRWEVRTVTSTRADDSLSTLLFQLSASLPLFHGYLLSLLLSLRLLFSLSSVSELTCCFPSAVHLLASLSVLWTATHP